MKQISAYSLTRSRLMQSHIVKNRLVTSVMRRTLSTIPQESTDSSFIYSSSSNRHHIPSLSEQDYLENSFAQLGLSKPLVSALIAQNILNPTPVQKDVIPRLLARESIVMAASTGSGKTFAYSLPTVQHLVGEELVGYKRLPQRPRCLVLVPTRELAKQVLQSIKHLSHFSKVSSSAIFGGEEYSTQKKMLDRMVDIVVASPGRLMQHKLQGNIFFSQVNTVIIDEVDTMLTQGFGKDIRDILKSSLMKQEKGEGEVQIIMATATLTKAVKSLLLDVEGKGLLSDALTSPPGTKKTLTKVNNALPSVKINVVEVDGVHRTLPHVKHNFELTKGKDKLIIVRDILERSRTKMKKTLVFCNTIDSCRAAEYGINDGSNLQAISYHGDMNSRERSENLEKFKSGEESILVCTDIAARGLDITDVDHVVMFDFPLNPVDYIHRAGRCGRAGKKGTVTSIIAKRDEVLSTAIQACIAQGLPIDTLSSAKRDYLPQGRLSHIISNQSLKSSRTPTSIRRSEDVDSKRIYSSSRVRSLSYSRESSDKNNQSRVPKAVRSEHKSYSGESRSKNNYAKVSKVVRTENKNSHSPPESRFLKSRAGARSSTSQTDRSFQSKESGRISRSTILSKVGPRSPRPVARRGGR